MTQRVLATFVTTTTYGSWLPGDLRGYVEDGRVLPANPRLLQHAQAMMTGDPVLLSSHDEDTLFEALCEACDEFHYRLLDVSIESWHLHGIVDHGFDSIPTMAGRLKNRMRQALDRGRIWTAGYCGLPMFDEAVLLSRRAYIAKHRGARMIAGERINRARR